MFIGKELNFMDSFCKSNIKEVRSNKKEEPAGSGPLGLASLSSASPPPLSPSAKVEEMTCQSLRLEIKQARNPICNDMISYMRLSLLKPKTADNDGSIFTRLAINMDCSFDNNTKFQKFKWRLTNKRSEFYANIPDGWQNDLAYGSAWEFYNELTMTKWIGKACYRLDRRENVQKMKLVDFTSIVVWTDGENMFYKLWIEDAEVQGIFNIESESKFYVSSSEPVKNFKPTRRGLIQL
jgi:hypothetical protein